VLKVIWVLKVMKVRKVFLGHRDIKEMMAHRVTWDLKVTKEYRVYLVRKEIKV
jgi:hypothetical protein